MQSRLPMIFILLTVVLDSMGIGLIMPVMPDLIQSLEGGDLGQAALWGGVLATTICGDAVPFWAHHWLDLGSVRAQTRSADRPCRDVI